MRRQLGEFDEHKARMTAAVENFKSALASAPSLQPSQQKRRLTKGILIAGGGESQFANAYANIQVST